MAIHLPSHLTPLLYWSAEDHLESAGVDSPGGSGQVVPLRPNAWFTILFLLVLRDPSIATATKGLGALLRLPVPNICKDVNKLYCSCLRSLAPDPTVLPSLPSLQSETVSAIKQYLI